MRGARKKKKIVLMVLGGIFIVILVAVFFSIFHKDYSGAQERVRGMLAVEKQAKNLAGTKEITEKNIGKVEQSLAAIGALESEAKKLGRSSALKDDEVKASYETIKQKVDKWVELSKIGQTLVKIVEGGDHESIGKLITKLERADNDKLKEMAKELKEYQKKASKFKEYYSSGKTNDYAKMQEEYGKIVAEGEAIKAKYEEMDFKKYVGMSEKKMVELFDDLKKLDKYLEEKK